MQCNDYHSQSIASSARFDNKLVLRKSLHNEINFNKCEFTGKKSKKSVLFQVFESEILNYRLKRYRFLNMYIHGQCQWFLSLYGSLDGSFSSLVILKDHELVRCEWKSTKGQSTFTKLFICIKNSHAAKLRNF